MVKLGYVSRNIPSPDTFNNLLSARMDAKAKGDTTTANALKLVTNTTYGAMLNQYNSLYDPLMGRSVCISGQLLLLELANHLVTACETLEVVALNTDGILISFEECEQPTVVEITEEWQERTGFVLEEEAIAKLIQKDVNGYIEVQENGTVKVKGGYLVRGISQVGAFNINNNACIVSAALREYFINGTPVEETIHNCSDIFQFQIIAKAGRMYKEAYHLVDGEQVPVQKVNRVYATSDERYGKLFKVKAETDSTAKIELLPDHCIIDNDNELTINDIDKTFYIELAKKRINDFKGIKPETSKRRKKDMPAATKTTPVTENVYQKLLRSRLQFLDEGAKKSGKNMHLSFKYFELDDIVPAAIRIFNEVGLLPLVTFDNEMATMTIINVDVPDETITFTSPMKELEVITSSRTGGEATNAMQRLGSVETYQRRYLYMMALDVCESDTLDADLGKPSPLAPPTKQPPATPETRAAVKKDLTQPDGQATALQIGSLKAALKKLDPAVNGNKEYIGKIAVSTESFTKMTKREAEQLILEVTERLADAGGSE